MVNSRFLYIHVGVVAPPAFGGGDFGDGQTGFSPVFYVKRENPTILFSVISRWRIRW